jgi:hypothetical protein
MSFTATASKSSEGGFEKAPPGNHPAVLVGIIDLGDQWDEPFSTKPDPKTGKVQKAKWVHRLYWVYELVTKKKQGMPGNHLIAIDLTFSMNEMAKMRKWVEARTAKTIPDGTSYDVMEELGKPVLLSVKMKGDYPKIEGVGAVPDGYPIPEPLTKPTAWKMDPAKLDEVPAWVPYLYGRKITDVIRDSRQIKGERKAQEPQRETAGVGAGDDGEDKDIPW